MSEGRPLFSRHGARKASVLVVDDDAEMRELLVALLEEDGLDVKAAAGANEALEMARAQQFDAVLSDIRMPQKDGFRLIRELEAVQSDAPVVLMTAFGSSALLTRAMQSGAFDYLMKPFTRTQLRAALERAFAG